MNADLSARAVVVVDAATWAERDRYREIVLEDAGERRTSIIELAPGARVPAALDTGRLDLFVLAGALRGTPPSTFLSVPAADAARRDAGWFTDEGCTLFVKHRPVPPPASNRSIALPLAKWRPSRPGLDEAPLYEERNGSRAVFLRFARGATIANHRHDDGEELLVLAGELRDEHGVYRRRTWVRQPPGSAHTVETPGGALTLTYAHHLV